MQLFKNLYESIARHGGNKAFCMDERYYSYSELAGEIAAIRMAIRLSGTQPGQKIGLVANDDLATYAAIIAIWFEGHSYVPLSPQMPIGRNREIIALAGTGLVIDSSEELLFPGIPVIKSLELPPATPQPLPVIPPPGALAYTVFTSGSTGIPKGVPITIHNLASFVYAFDDLGLAIGENDRFLQMFELTFDLSVMSYLIPLLKGACVYTIPKNQIKYNYIYKLLEEYELTVALMIPTVIHYLRPYFEEINCPQLKYNLFCGEALPLDVTRAWSHCIPNAQILNVYGPSEATIFCTHYRFDPASHNKSHNGILSIGKAMNGTGTIVIDELNQPVSAGESGELCLSGQQLTPGYLNDEEKNRMVFFNLAMGDRVERYYKTGDLCIIDADADILYIGRADAQVKIQGYRVELPEIEFHAKACLVNRNLAAIAYQNKSGSQEIGLVIEGTQFDTKDLMSYLKTRVPFYMLPASIAFETVFPQNNNGKTDRKKLLTKFQQL